MRKRPPAILLALVGSLALAAPAQALISQIGDVGSLPSPSCPGVNCTAIVRTTGVQTSAAGSRRTYVSPVSGRIVAFTLKLGNPTATEQAFFNSRAGAPAEAQVVVLRPSKSSPATLLRAVAVSEVFALTPWFGQTVEFPLTTTLPVKKGELIGLTVPTWAPVLAVSQGSSNAWRASRKQCDTASVFQQTALTRPRYGRFSCVFSTARLTYTATVISTP